MKRKRNYFGMVTALLLASCTTVEPDARSTVETVAAPSNSIPKEDDFQLGRIALVRGDYETALKHLNAAPKSAAAHLNIFQEGPLTYRGQVHYLLGNFSQAREDLAQAIRQNDKDFMARLYLGLVILREQKTPETLPTALTFERLLEAFKNHLLPERIATLVKERGVGFNGLTDEQEKKLRKAGANKDLIELLKTTADDTRRQDAAKEIVQALREMQTWLKEVQESSDDTFWDPGRRISSQIAATLALIANKKADDDKLLNDIQWVARSLEEKLYIRDNAIVS